MHHSPYSSEGYPLTRALPTAPEHVLDFSSTANFFAVELTQQLVADTPYPFLPQQDPHLDALAQALAKYEQTEPERILLGNGGAALIWLFIQGLEPRKIFFIGPVSVEYIAACNAYNIAYEICTPKKEEDFTCGPAELTQLWETDADLVVLATPNPFTGLSPSNIYAMLDMLRAPRVLIDHSYKEFLYGSESYTQNSLSRYMAEARRGVSLFSLNNISPFFCCPGLPLAYLTGDRNTLTRLATLRPAQHLTPFSQRMAQRFLDNLSLYRSTLPALHHAVAGMGRELRRADCIDPSLVWEGPSFLCCGLRTHYQGGAVQAALLQHRIAVRNCDAIPGMPKGFIRVQARAEKDVEKLLTAINSI